MREGTLPPRAVAITVDDGTYDFHAVAYPVFKRLGVPVTLYVSTYHVLDHRPVFDVAFRYLFWKAGTSGKVELPDPLAKDSRPLRTASDREQAATRVCETVWRERWSAEKKHDWLGRFTRRMGLDWGDFLRSRVLALMRPEEIGALHRVRAAFPPRRHPGGLRAGRRYSAKGRRPPPRPGHGRTPAGRGTVFLGAGHPAVRRSLRGGCGPACPLPRRAGGQPRVR